MKTLAKTVIIFHAKYNANIPRISSTDPSYKAPICAAETCRKNGSAEAEVFQADQRGL